MTWHRPQRKSRPEHSRPTQKETKRPEYSKGWQLETLSAFYHEWHQDRTLKPLTIFVIFVKVCHYGAYEMGIFAELADNEPSGCRAVVGANSLKWGHFGGIFVQLSVF